MEATVIPTALLRSEVEVAVDDVRFSRNVYRGAFCLPHDHPDRRAIIEEAETDLLVSGSAYRDAVDAYQTRVAEEKAAAYRASLPEVSPARRAAIAARRSARKADR
jgi:hypothetical protein